MIVRSVKGFPDYAVSECGVVYSIKGSLKLKHNLNSTGYLRVVLYKDKKPKQVFVHILVYEAWKGKVPEGLVIDHIDDDKTNPHASNLQAITQSKNCSKKANSPCPALISPDGNLFVPDINIGDFCEKFRLPSNNFNKMTSGKRKSCLGWRLA